MYISNECGSIKFKLEDLLKKKQLSKNKLSLESNVRFDTIQRMCKGNLSRIDLDIICRLCKYLNCQIEDIIEYSKLTK